MWIVTLASFLFRVKIKILAVDYKLLLDPQSLPWGFAPTTLSSFPVTISPGPPAPAMLASLILTLLRGFLSETLWPWVPQGCLSTSCLISKDLPDHPTHSSHAHHHFPPHPFPCFIVLMVMLVANIPCIIGVFIDSLSLPIDPSPWDRMLKVCPLCPVWYPHT